MHQTKSYESPPSEKPHPQFSAKRNLDEEGERRPIGNSRWKLKGLISTRIAPIRLPASPTQQSFSNSYSGDSLALNSDRESSRYNSSHHQDNLVSSTRNKSQWQSARVQVSGNSCMTLSQLPSESKLHSLSTKTTTCSDSSDEYPKSKALEPSDESDHDFEIEGNDHDNDCDDDDSSVKVEVGDHYAVSRRTHRFVDLGNITLDCD